LNDAGIIISPSERTLIRYALPQLQVANKLDYINYWGKIQGVKADYYIIKGFNEFLGQSKYFYSIDCQEWPEVPPVDERIEQLTGFDQGLFIGDPTLKSRFRDLV
jgi:radial spoke head protein 9